MANFEQKFDGETITAGGSATTSVIKVADVDFVVYHIISLNGNATDIDIDAEAKTSEVSPMALYDSSIDSDDLSTYTNNSRIYTYDTRGINYIRFKHIDNRSSGDDLSLDSYIGREEY